MLERIHLTIFVTHLSIAYEYPIFPHRRKTCPAKKIFDANGRQVNSLQILAGQKLKEHVTSIPAFLICIQGTAIYEDEQGTSEKLGPGDFVNIEVNIKHWLVAEKDSNFLLIK